MGRRSFPIATLALMAAAGAAIAQTASLPTAKDFALAAAQSDRYEIVAGHVAITQSRDPKIRAFAKAMIDAHTRTSQDLSRAAMASGLPPPPPAMGSDQAAMLSSLQSLRGADFDKAYAGQQVIAHSGALAVEQSYATAGTDMNLKAAARAAVPIIQRHLEMAQQIKVALSGG